MATIHDHHRRSESSDGLVGEEKTFTCTHPGCERRFTRAEHMQRHALNHMPGGLSCDLCSAHFKRPDLLKRHMDRHRQKDLEAGGPGCGTLDTRKRSWKAPDGSVVEKRPCPNPSGRGQGGRGRTQPQQVPSPEPELNEEHSLSSLDPGGHQGGLGDKIPPETQRRQPALDLRPGNVYVDQSYSFGRAGIFNPSDTVNHFSGFPPSLQSSELITTAGQFDIDGTQPGSWGETSLFSGQLDYDQVFQPDTASSFNMPYTTALDYNWLFDIQDSSAPTTNTNPMNTNQQFDSRGSNHPPPTRTHPNLAITPESMKSAQLWTEPIDINTQEPKRAARPAGPSDSLQTETQTPRRQVPNSTREGAPDSTASRRRTCTNTSPATRQTYMTISRHAPVEPERPLSSLRKPLIIPTIGADVRQRLLDVVDAARPCLPDQRFTIWEHPLLSVDSLKAYLGLFFTRFNTAYPLIHLETFDCRKIEPLLLLSILLLGATYSNKDCHQLAVCIHDVMRPSIFAHAGFSSRPELWTLQTILLVECFGKSRAGQKQHDMSHLFHGLLINLIRRSDCQSVRPQGPPPISGEENAEALDRAWRKWAEGEQKKRLALLCFMWDTQHAVLFCQSLCMSAFELRLELPCSQSIWEARDAASWASAWRSSLSDQRLFYLPTLKSYLTPSASRPSGLTGFSRVLVLHGLMSISWDMGRRDQTALGVVSQDSFGMGWRRLLSTAYDAWKSDFDAYCTGFSAPPENTSQTHAQGGRGNDGDDEVRRVEFESFASAYKALYHSAQALLNMDFLDVQIYAGARHILGRPVQQRDYHRSAQVVKRWAASSDTQQREHYSGARHDHRDADENRNPSKQSASDAAWHAARMLRETRGALNNTEAMNLFHVPWCLYLATLTCWAYHHARPSRGCRSSSRRSFDDFDDDAELEEDEMIWDPQGEMETLITSMSDRVDRSEVTLRRERKRTNGLVWIMADILTTVRWGIVHAGVVVLRGLVPQRLINQYEEVV